MSGADFFFLEKIFYFLWVTRSCRQQLGKNIPINLFENNLKHSATYNKLRNKHIHTVKKKSNEKLICKKFGRWRLRFRNNFRNKHTRKLEAHVSMWNSNGIRLAARMQLAVSCMFIRSLYSVVVSRVAFHAKFPSSILSWGNGFFNLIFLRQANIYPSRQRNLSI